MEGHRGGLVPSIGRMASDDSTASPSDRRPGMPAWLNLALRVAVTFGLLAYALSDVKWRDVLRVLANADWTWWVAGLVTHVLVQVVALLPETELA